MVAKLEKLLSLTLAIAALVMMVLVIRRELAPASSPSPAPERYVADWEELIETGTEIAQHDAPIKIIEFLDLQCPACKAYHAEQFSHFSREIGINNYSHTIIHFPLKSHPLAASAANAAECARVQGRFGEFIVASMQGQAQFGKRSWTSYAAEAGVTDTVAFAQCVSSAAYDDRVQAGRTLALSMKLDGTPTLMVNGWLFSNPPTGDALLLAVKRLKPKR